MATPIWTGAAADNSYTTANNWSTGVVPVATDNVWLSRSNSSILSNLNQSAVALGSFTQDMSFTGGALVGVPASGSTAAIYLKINSPTFRLGFPVPSSNSATGPTRLNIDAGTIASTFTIFDSARTGNDQSFPPIRLLGGNLTVTALGGLFGVAMVASESATLTSLTMQANSGAVSRNLIGYVGPNCTISSLTMYTGTLFSSSTVTVPTATITGNATYVVNGANTHTTLAINSGSATVQQNVAGTYSNCTIFGTLDCSSGSGGVTIQTKALLYPGCTINDPFNRITFSAGWQIVNGGPQSITMIRANSQNYTG